MINRLDPIESNEKSDGIYQKRISQMLSDYNRKIGVTSIISSIILCLAVFALFVFYSEKNYDPKADWQVFYKYCFAIVLVPILFFVLSKLKYHNYWLFKNVVLFSFLKIKLHFIRIIITIVVYYIGLMIIFPYVIYTENLPAKSFLPIDYYDYVLLSAIVFSVSFIVFILPRLIIQKVNINKDTDNSSYSWIYWYYFFKSRIKTSPFLKYLVPGLIVFLFLVALFIPYVNKTGIISDSKEPIPTFELFNDWLKIDSFSLLFSVASLFVSLGIILCNELLKNYERIYQCYEEYSTFQLRDHIFAGREIKTIIIGFGNLSRIILGNRIGQIIKKISESNDSVDINCFEILIDNDYKIRVIPKDIIVIEHDGRMFEEIRTDPNSGLSYGFLNGLDIIPSNTTNELIPSELALFAINGDGGNLSLLHNANLDRSNLVINTTSDPDMGFRLKHAVENEVKINPKPTIITTVEDSKTSIFLEETSESSFFPLHAAQIEGTLIGLRLYSYFRKIVDNTPKNENCTPEIFNIPFNIVIIGNGKALYYTIETFRLYLLKDYFNSYDKNNVEKFIRELLNNAITLISDDSHIVNESFPDFDCISGIKRKWNIYFPNEGKLSLNIFTGNPDKYNVLADAWNWIMDKKKKEVKHTIFVVSSTSTNNALRILENIRQLISYCKVSNASILTSVAIEASKKIETIISKIPLLNDLKYGYFPSSFDDFTIKKNGIIGSQINSIAKCVDNQCVSSSIQTDSYSSEAVFCIPNLPGKYVQLLANLSQLKGISTSNNQDWFPSVLFSYTYPLISEDKEFTDSFVLRADMILKGKQPTNGNENNINAYHIIGSQNAREKINYLIDNFICVKNDHSCDHFSHRCPINSINAKNENKCAKNESSQNIDENSKENKSLNDLAMVKIWAEKNRFPGALALALCDFLMIGKEISFSGQENSKVLSIAFDNCQLCHFEQNVLSHVYVYNETVCVKMIKGISKMLTDRNIRAIKVKIVKDSKGWIKYLRELKQYMNVLSPENYELIKLDETIVIYRKDIWANKDSNSFIKNDL